MIPHVERIFAKRDDGVLVDNCGVQDMRVVETAYLQVNDPERSYRFIVLESEAGLSQFVGDNWDYRLLPLSEDEIAQALFDLNPWIIPQLP